jgi:epoxyqueuosine reductase
MEKPLAARSGIGWQGKHTVLIQGQAGSWFFLGEILTDLELEEDAPAVDQCGTCVACIDVCPTDAIVGPYQLDARKCIAYLTIEYHGVIPREIRPQMGAWIFGCDLCLEICPWNKHPVPAREQDLIPREATTSPILEELIGMTDDEFLGRFAGTPVMRARRDGLVRSVCVAMGNSGDRSLVPALIRALDEDVPLVQIHAAWALGRLGGEEAVAALKAARDRATGRPGDELVEEIEFALEGLGVD